MNVREKPRASRSRPGVLLPVGAAPDRQEHTPEAALWRRALGGPAEGRRVQAVRRQSRVASPGAGCGRAAAWTADRHRRDPEGSGAARRSALADREPRPPLRAVRVECAEGQARRGQSARREGASLPPPRPDGGGDRESLRPAANAQPRLPAADVPGDPADSSARRLHRGLSQGGDRRRGSGFGTCRRLPVSWMRRRSGTAAWSTARTSPASAVCRATR